MRFIYQITVCVWGFLICMRTSLSLLGRTNFWFLNSLKPFTRKRMPNTLIQTNYFVQRMISVFSGSLINLIIRLYSAGKLVPSKWQTFALKFCRYFTQILFTIYLVIRINVSLNVSTLEPPIFCITSPWVGARGWFDKQISLSDRKRTSMNTFLSQS